jgi:hypothetical protein
VILYRPVGLEELVLLFASGLRGFPPRLPEQPIFYPVTTSAYAEQIARDWNAPTGSLAGYVTRFELPDTYAARFPVQTVGSREHQELWVPAEQLDEWNGQMLGPVEVTHAFFGPGFRGFVPPSGPLAGQSADEQLAHLAALPAAELEGVIAAQRLPVFLHIGHWMTRGPAELLVAIRRAWSMGGAELALPLG